MTVELVPRGAEPSALATIARVTHGPRSEDGQEKQYHSTGSQDGKDVGGVATLVRSAAGPETTTAAIVRPANCP